MPTGSVERKPHPSPLTPRERMFYDPDELVDPRVFAHYQKNTDLVRLAAAARVSRDPEFTQTVLTMWNRENPDNQYSTADLLVGVESNPW